MRTIFIAFSLTVLLGTVFTLQSTQGSLSAKNLRGKFIQTNFGSALLKMIELQNEVKIENGAQKLFKTLDLVKKNLAAQEAEENGSYDVDYSNHNREVTRVQQKIAQLTASKATTEEEIKNLQGTGDQLSSNLKGLQAQRDGAKKGAENEEFSLRQLTTTYTEQSADYAKAIQLLQDAVAQLDSAAQAQNTAFTSFVETNKDKLTFFSENLEPTIKKINKNAFVKPLVNFFIQMKSSKTQPDLETITRAKTALVDLRNFYLKGQADLDKQYESQTAQHAALLTNLQLQIKDFEDTLIPRVEQDIKFNADAVVAKQQEVSIFSDEIATNKKNLEDENTSFATREETHILLLDQYARELSIINDTENVLVRQYGTPQSFDDDQ